MSTSSWTQRAQIQTIKRFAIPLILGDKPLKVMRDTKNAYDSLLDAIGSAKIVLIGEASHGTKEFYRERALITKRLIEEKGFNTVVVEADWTDAYRANRYVLGTSKKDTNAVDALKEFVRFPTWMWRNTEVVPFLEWLKKYNDKIKNPARKIGWYGMDLYCLVSSANAVINYLHKIDPALGKRAKQRYECFLRFGEDTQAYAMSTAMGIAKSCEDEVIANLIELQKAGTKLVQQDGYSLDDELFYATVNAKVVKDAEEYYRTMMSGGAKSWNLRDKHMASLISDLIAHKERNKTETKVEAKVVVWAHNSHLGDARYTEMGKRRGEWNVGQLLREKYGKHVYNIGFTTSSGTVSAASGWDKPRRTMNVNQSTPDSIEGLFHMSLEKGVNEMLLIFRGKDGKQAEELVEALKAEKPERYIGVIYKPKMEVLSHYADSIISKQFDAVIHVDVSSALIPLDEKSSFPEKADETVPDLYSLVEPTGL